ncbi:MAG: arginase family protein [Candidatus Limnocylindrales bacterium]
MTAARSIEVIGVPFNSAGLTNGVARAPAALRAAGLIDEIRMVGIDVEDHGDVSLGATAAQRDPASHVIAPDALESMIRTVGPRVAASLIRGAFPLVVGGDCPILLGCLAGLLAHQSSCGLVFVDGHEDAYPPDRSPSGEAADMELGFALGLTDAALPPDLRDAIPRLRFEDVVVLGPRDQAELRESGIETLEGRLAYLASGAVAADPAAAAAEAAARMAPLSSWWLHVDLDVLATASLAAGDYPQPGGLDWDGLGQLCAAALADPGVAGWDITIYNPDLDPDGSAAERITVFIAEALRLGQPGS